MPQSARRILVVDDEPVIRLFLQELLEDEGYEVVTAQSIAEGLQALKAQRFHLVVTDKNLPDGTGFEIVHAAKAGDPPCEAMIITGYASLDSAVMALQIGAYDYILKPIEDVDVLLEKARKAIEKQELWSELLALRARASAAAAPAAVPAPEAAPASPLAEISGDVPQLMKLAELGSLIPMLAHEMRQPLAGIKGYVDLLLHKKTVEEGVRAKLTSIQEQVMHVAGLIDSLTSYSRVSAAGHTVVDVSRPVHLALSIFPVLKTSGRYELELDLPSDLPPIRGNVNAIQQVVVNLLKNAKDALDEVGGGRLLVRATFDEAAEQVRLRVQDGGPGIPPECRARLFEPFFTTKQEGVGTGLGLTISRQIVSEHGGRIDVESPVGPEGGTAFTLVFPAVREVACAAGGSGAARAEAR
jgi:signal transduction histidine kinase